MNRSVNRFFQLLSIAYAIFLAPSCPGNGLKEPKAIPQSDLISVDRVNTTPDLMQSIPVATLPYDGQAYCGPVAVSNSFVWLAHHGYPKLGLLGGADTPATQGRMARFLGCSMKTSNGTTAQHLIEGAEQFVTDKGYKIEYLKYQGWEFHDDRYSTGRESQSPDLNWIKSGLDGPSGVWLTIGFYNYVSQVDEFVPFSQHWVTLVGFGQDKNGKKDPNILIIHDPATRSGEATSHDYVRLERISHGNFSQVPDRINLQAKGWYKMTGDLKMKKGANCAILDGAVIMKLKKGI